MCARMEIHGSLTIADPLPRLAGHLVAGPERFTEAAVACTLSIGVGEVARGGRGRRPDSTGVVATASMREAIAGQTRGHGDVEVRSVDGSEERL